MATEYGIIVKAKPDTSKFDEELNSALKGKKREIDVDVAVSEEAVKKLNNIDERFKKIKQTVQTGFRVKIEDDGTTRELTRQIENLKKQIDTLSETESPDKLNEKLKSLVTELNEYKNKGVEVFKVTQQFKDEAGELQTAVTYVTEKGEILNSEVVKSQKVFEGYNTALKKTENRIQTLEKTTTSYVNAQGQLVKQVYSKNSAGQEMITIEKTTRNLGQTIKETEQLVRSSNGTWQKYGETLREVTNNELQLQKVYEEINKYVNKKGQTVTRTYSKDSDGTQHAKIQKEYEDELGRKVQEVTEYIKYQGKAWERVGETSKKVINDEIAQQEKLAKVAEETSNRIAQTHERTRVFKDAKTGAYTEETTFIDKDGVETIKTLEKYTNMFGDTTEVTTIKVKELDGTIRVISRDTKEYVNQVAKQEKLEQETAQKAQMLADAEAKRNAELEKRIVSVNNYKSKEKEVLDLRDKTIHKLQTEVKETTNANGIITKVTKTTDKFVDSQGMLNTKVIETTEKFEEVDGKLKQVGETIVKTTTDIEKSRTGLNQLGQSFSDIIVKVAKFYLASLPIRAVQKAITSAIETVKDFDSALTEFKKVSDLSGESLEIYTEKLEKLGKLTARTRTEMIQMATEFKRSSYSDEESAELAQVASLYQNIADEELSASDAASVLISQMKAFQKQGIEAEHVIDSINEVANRNAVSSGDIGRGLTQAGAALSTYGNTFEQTIGLITAGTEIDYWKVS